MLRLIEAPWLCVLLGVTAALASSGCTDDDDDGSLDPTAGSDLFSPDDPGSSSTPPTPPDTSGGFQGQDCTKNPCCYLPSDYGMCALPQCAGGVSICMSPDECRALSVCPTGRATPDAGLLEDAATGDATGGASAVDSAPDPGAPDAADGRNAL